MVVDTEAKEVFWPFFIAFIVDARSVNHKIDELIAPILAEEGLQLFDVSLVGSKGNWVLRVTIEKPGGSVNLDDCVRASHAIEDVIEVEGGLTDAYHLEVSSPGLNRPLKKKEHFEKVLGEVIRVETEKPLNGRRNYKGVLEALQDNQLMIKIDGVLHAVPLDQVAKANLEYKI